MRFNRRARLDTSRIQDMRSKGGAALPAAEAPAVSALDKSGAPATPAAVARARRKAATAARHRRQRLRGTKDES